MNARDALATADVIANNYNPGYIAYLSEIETSEGTGYALTLSKDEMPPFKTMIIAPENLDAALATEGLNTDAWESIDEYL